MNHSHPLCVLTRAFVSLFSIIQTHVYTAKLIDCGIFFIQASIYVSQRRIRIRTNQRFTVVNVCSDLCHMHMNHALHTSICIKCAYLYYTEACLLHVNPIQGIICPEITISHIQPISASSFRIWAKHKKSIFLSSCTSFIYSVQDDGMMIVIRRMEICSKTPTFLSLVHLVSEKQVVWLSVCVCVGATI